MIHLHHQSPILLAVQPVDFRKGIDGFVAVVRDVLAHQPNNGHYYIFINRDHSLVCVLSYDGAGYWLMTKRLSKSNFVGWPRGVEAVSSLLATHYAGYSPAKYIAYIYEYKDNNRCNHVKLIFL